MADISTVYPLFTSMERAINVLIRLFIDGFVLLRLTKRKSGSICDDFHFMESSSQP